MRYTRQLKDIIEQEKNRMMLYPDMSRSTYESSDHFVFAAPCTHGEWQTLWTEIQMRNRKLSDPKSRTKNNDYLAWITVEDDSDEQVIIIMQGQYDTDDEAETTAAWVRVSEEFRGMIYALKYDSTYGSSQTLAQIVCRTAGVPPSQVRHVIITKRNNV